MAKANASQTCLAFSLRTQSVPLHLEQLHPVAQCLHLRPQLLHRLLQPGLCLFRRLQLGRPPFQLGLLLLQPALALLRLGERIAQTSGRLFCLTTRNGQLKN